mmetsp:Transcript_14701/g.43134  ORF Transcript_14701/g.43134 Transcript_14701/m.43134 type:complete len:317 (+) Transcript_14701:365-1315(+)
MPDRTRLTPVDSRGPLPSRRAQSASSSTTTAASPRQPRGLSRCAPSMTRTQAPSWPLSPPRSFPRRPRAPALSPTKRATPPSPSPPSRPEARTARSSSYSPRGSQSTTPTSRRARRPRRCSRPRTGRTLRARRAPSSPTPSSTPARARPWTRFRPCAQRPPAPAPSRWRTAPACPACASTKSPVESWWCVSLRRLRARWARRWRTARVSWRSCRGLRAARRCASWTTASLPSLTTRATSSAPSAWRRLTKPTPAPCRPWSRRALARGRRAGHPTRVTTCCTPPWKGSSGSGWCLGRWWWRDRSADAERQPRLGASS